MFAFDKALVVVIIDFADVSTAAAINNILSLSRDKYTTEDCK